ncbi:hypothetical protein TRFO_24593 [Tritrichomonas foetus]|uniref:Uncharacterized protein n=1 Tax=Tritrichomonas foetus TaxID=1144522 RepID=A0A1J4K7Z2_9EUKA|nr:hypothetical protein TRFO_24593 [Tritrichomonas foetus]|eukprot:OHT07323.1 hypothetical protein TRFO_24593 [Tritrichomonas foetus]
MNVDYKSITTLENPLILRAAAFLSTDRENPFKNEPSIQNEFVISNEEYQQLAAAAFHSFQALLNKNFEENDLKNIHAFVHNNRFDFLANNQFNDPKFAEAIHFCLLPGHSDVMCEEAILILSNLYFYHPPFLSNLISEPIIDQLIDILNSHLNFYMRHDALLTLQNFYLICEQTKKILIDKDIFIFLRNYLMTPYHPNEYRVGLKMLYFLCIDEFENFLPRKNTIDNWSKFLQFIPIYPLMLNNLLNECKEKALWTLSMIINHDKIFEYCRALQIHSLLAKCCARIVINPSYAYHLYRCVFAFVKRKYIRVFSNITIFNGIIAILSLKTNKNISSLLFTVALLINSNGKMLYDLKINELCKFYANEGIFENKIAACYCLSHFLIDLPYHLCDILANDDIVDTLCGAIECFDVYDLIAPLRAFRKLIEINPILYPGKFLQNGIDDYLYQILNETIPDLKENPDLIHECQCLITYILENIRNLPNQANYHSLV